MVLTDRKAPLRFGQIRLQLHAQAYNLGNAVRALNFAEGIGGYHHYGAAILV